MKKKVGNGVDHAGAGAAAVSKKPWDLDGGVTLGLAALGVSGGSILSSGDGFIMSNFVSLQVSLLGLLIALIAFNCNCGKGGGKSNGRCEISTSTSSGYHGQTNNGLDECEKWTSGSKSALAGDVVKGIAGVTLASAMANSSVRSMRGGFFFFLFRFLPEPGRWMSTVEFWGFSSVLMYVTLVAALPGLLRPMWPVVRRLESLHNTLLALASLAMLIGICVATLSSGKIGAGRGGGVNALLCAPFDEEDLVFYLTSRLFFWSKFWEWFDTSLLVAKGKKVSWLHYTHHASTAILTSLNMVPILSGMWSVVCATNSFVHTWMYGYYALPRWGMLRRTRVWLTRVQIVQHVMVMASVLYVTDQKRKGNACHHSLLPLMVGLALYLMYFLFFGAFYWRTYASPKSGRPRNGAGAGARAGTESSDFKAKDM